MTGADIIGHLDLITKYNTGGEDGGQGALFDEGHPRYVAAWQKAVDKLLPTGVPFEINTGGMSRKYRADAYPAKPILDYIAAKGGRFILSSDSHNTETLCRRFADYRDYMK
jgi:histidinol-phosphatase (PHP family)